MKKEIKVCFLNQWPEYKGLEQFKKRHPYNNKKFELIETNWESSDLIIFGPFGGKRTHIGYGKNYYGVPEKYIKFMPVLERIQRKKATLFVTGEYCMPILPFCDYSISFHNIQSKNHLYQPEWVTSLWELGYDINSLIDNKNLSNSFERNFCNFIYSRRLERREKYYKLLSSIDTIDVYGMSFDDDNPVILPGGSIGKIRKLKDYKFTISIENKIRNKYVTEKIIHPIISRSIPIYSGSKKISNIFNPDFIIDINSFSDEGLVDYINELNNSKERYEDRLNSPIFLNNKIPSEAKKENSINFFDMMFNEVL